MSSFSYGHGEIEGHQHRFAFALMFLAVSLATLAIIAATHSVKDRDSGRTPAAPSAPQCETLGQAAMRYCIFR